MLAGWRIILPEKQKGDCGIMKRAGYIFVILLAVVVLFPVVYMFVNAFAKNISMETTRSFCLLRGAFWVL